MKPLTNLSLTKKNVSWSDMVRQNIPNDTPRPRPRAGFSCNEDGSVNLIPTREFLIQARKQWDSSCIGHFIGGGLDFKFVKDRALSMWRKKGLQNVYHNSKGYFTFRFGNIEEMQYVLRLNSVQIGGRTLYLQPWMESCEFKRNVIEKMTCWIKLGEVPPTYWSCDGLTMISGLIGKPLMFDEITSQFQPLKYARVQIELEYSAPMPPFVWVLVINSRGEEDILRVEVEYSQLPFSCILCKAFGHSLARCNDNPEREQPQSKRLKQNKERNGHDIGNVCKVQNSGPEIGIETDVNNQDEDYLANREDTPYVVGKFMGCDVVMDEDHVLQQVQAVNIDNVDDLEDQQVLLEERVNPVNVITEPVEYQEHNKP